ncbi:aldo/keto reductase [Sutterella sp.]|uniref:aldo/keto reductase n=1 Tax=Sutterella sp. TaxID=1981025 RepID=UPI0026E01E38|nr:aldo/keto reductase [Sutterella sp.]MDO5532777.1 aldo/keto reductase [Sutterella sp.]
MKYISVEMPLIGYGVYQVTPAECVRCVKDALEVGYRSIDTAQAYANEAEVGQAIAESGVARGDIFLTTKIWISKAGEKTAAASIDESLRKLRTDYVDLLLIHQPFGDYYGTWRAMEAAYRAGKVRAIGVSNFYPDRYIDLDHFAEVKPMVNQVEAHPFDQQRAAQEIMRKRGCAVMAWAPLAEGRNGLFTNPVLEAIGAQYGKTPAQVALRWLIERDIVVIPKSVRRERMAENLAILDFELSAADHEAIRTLDLGHSLWFDHHDPAVVEQFMGWVNIV